MKLRVSFAARDAGGPAPGTIDTLRIMARDAEGALLAPAVVVPISAGQRTFQATIDVPAGPDRTLTVLALGQRELAGDEEPPTRDRGVLHLDRIEGLDIEPNALGPPRRVEVVLRPFVPEFGAPELLEGQRHRIRWNQVRNAVRYEVARRPASIPAIVSTTDTVFEGDGLPATYRVRAIERDGAVGAFSDDVRATLPPPPTTPTGLVAQGISPTRIDLSWNAASGTPPVRYDLRRIPESGGPTLVFADLAETTWSDSLLDPEGAYRYSIRALNRGGGSEWSTEVSAVPLPGAPQRLTAEATSPVIVHLTWAKGTGRVTEYRIERRTLPGVFTVIAEVGGAETSFDDRSVSARTAYEYRLVARNGSGSSAPSGIAAVMTPAAAPVAPTLLSALAMSPTQVDLTWRDNSADETGFELQRAEGAAGAFATVVTTPANVTQHSDRDLTERSAYRYRVRSRLDALVSDWSAELSVSTPASVPAAPSALVAEALSPSSVRLTWVDNATNEESIRVEERNSFGTWDTATTLPANTTTVDIVGLAAARVHTFRVLAVNSAGLSDPSNEASVLTPPEVPNAPTDLAAQAPAYDRVTLRWVDNSNNETEFEIRRQTSPSDIVFFTVGPNVENYVDTGVIGSTTYFYSVRARAGAAVSAFAGPVSTTTPLGPPGVPENLSAGSIGSTQLILTWTAATGTVDVYDLEFRRPPSAFEPLATLVGRLTSHTATNLLSGTLYQFRIRARNAAGSSEFSDVVQATTLQVPPEAPTALAGSAPSSRIVRLTWTDNSSNESRFSIEERRFGESAFAEVASAPADATAISLLARRPATRYEYRVRAGNEAGPSGYTGIVQVVTPDTLPATPTALEATALSSSRVEIQWQPETDGGSITGFELERRLLPGPFALASAVGASTTRLEDTGLTPGATYDYRVRARNGLGPSPYSGIVSVTLPIDPPGVPEGFSGAPVSLTTIRVTWSPGPGGAAETFDVESRVSGTTPYTGRFVVDGSLSSYDIGNLTIDTWYDVRVRAVNSAGTSDWSSVITVQTLDVPPEAPSGLTATDLPPTFQTIQLQWQDNSLREDGFLIQSTGPDTTEAWSTLAVVGANTTSYSYIPPSPSATGPMTSPASPAKLSVQPSGCRFRNYRVRAFNQGGISAWSNIAEVCD